MNPETFFDNFELLADTSNGVQKLRELILQLVVQGKLVPQDPNDEPAAVLLGKIKDEKERLVKEGKIRKQRPLLSIENNNIPFKLPQSWVWVSLGAIVDYNSAQKVSPNDIPDDAWLLDLENIEKDTSRIVQRIIFKNKKSKSTKSKFENGDVLYGKLRPYLNKVVVADGAGYCTTEIIPLRGYYGIFPKYLMYALKRPDFLEYVNSKTYGVKMPRLGTEDARNAPFPLPPLTEQKRIAAKADQLMALCDELEAQQQKKQEARLHLNNAALDKVLTAHEPDEFAHHWQRICDNFDLLYDNHENVGELRKAILQLAVQGKLVPQDPNDELAAVLLERIKVEKERLVKEKKIKKINTLPLIKSKKEAFKLPDGWEFIRLGEIVQKLGAGSTPKGGKTVYQNQGIKFLRSQNVWNNGLSLQNVAYIPLEIHKRMNGTVIGPGDILLNITGASIGRCATVPDNFDEGNVSQHVTIVRLIDKALRYYVHICLISPFIQDVIMDVQVGISREGLSMSQLKEFLIPIPPLEEQRRIVAKVDQLMALCDDLESKLKQSQTDGEKLMVAAVGELIGA